MRGGAKTIAVEHINYSFIPNHRETMEALTRAPLTGRQLRLVILILNQTDGFLREDDHLGPKFLEEKTGLKRQHCYNILASLKALGIVSSPRPGSFKVNPPSLWKLPPNQSLTKGKSSTADGIGPVPPMVSTSTADGIENPPLTTPSREYLLERTTRENHAPQRQALRGSPPGGKKAGKREGDPRVLGVLRAAEEELGYQIPNYPKEGAAVKRGLSMGFTLEEVLGCWRVMKGFTFWRGKWLPFAKVVENLGEYRAGRLSDGSARRGYAETRVPKDYTDPKDYPADFRGK